MLLLAVAPSDVHGTERRLNRDLPTSVVGVRADIRRSRSNGANDPNRRERLTHVVGAVLGFMRRREFQPLLGGEATCGPPARRTKVIGSLSSGVFADTFSG